MLVIIPSADLIKKMFPNKLQVDNCFGYSLKHATIIIGVIQSILAFMLMILLAAYAQNPHELIDMSDPSIIPDVQVLRNLLIVLAVASAVHCIFSIFLIFGAETNRPCLLLPYLIFKPIAIIAYVISLIIAIAEHSSENMAYFILGHLVVASIILFIAAYKLVVVSSFYRYLKSLNF